MKTETAKIDAKRLCERHATSVDFCRVFYDDMNHLYTCAFLLLADHTKAEQCFVKSLEECFSAGPVFTDWAETYAQRTMVKNALQIVSVSRLETLTDAQSRKTPQVEPAPNGHAVAEAITALPVFQRFVYVLSVLERYSDGECASLLACGIAEIVAARTEALENVATLLASLKPDGAESRPETARTRRSQGQTIARDDNVAGGAMLRRRLSVSGEQIAREVRDQRARCKTFTEVMRPAPENAVKAML